MVLYFTNDSKQKKELIESDYAEDIYDTVIAFFEEKQRFPHFLHFENDKTCARVLFGSYTEAFIIEDFSKEEIEELENLFKVHDI